MSSKDDFAKKITPFNLDDNVLIWDANSKFVAVVNSTNAIIIYSSDTFEKLFSKKGNKKILHIQFHPIYYDVFSVTFNGSMVCLYYINIHKNILEIKVKYFSDKENSLIKTIFSPYNKGEFLASISNADIKIWKIDDYFNYYNININVDLNDIINFNFKWSRSGQYLIFPKNQEKIEIFSLYHKSIVYHLQNIGINYYFLEDLGKVIIVDDENIYLWNPQTNKEEFKVSYDGISLKQSEFNFNNSLLYLLNGKKIFIFDLITYKKIFEHELKKIKNFVLLKGINNNNMNLFSKLLFHSQKNIIKSLEIIAKNYVLNISNEKQVPDNFWENSITEIKNDYEFLSNMNNIIEENEIKTKNYLNIDKIHNEFIYLLKNKTLEERREMVNEYVNNFKIDEDINLMYLNFIKNIIKDNTNKNLLKKYLKFLSKNKTKLEEKFSDNFESFNNEIKQFESCFELSELKELGHNKINSEIEKLNDFLLELSKMKTTDEINIFIEKRKEELDNFRFNQPISFKDNPELYYCRCRIVLLYNLKVIMMKKQTEKLNNMIYCINEVLKRNILKNNEIINNSIYITFVLILMAVPQRKIITDYNLNLIDNNDIDVTKESLLNLGFKYNDWNQSYENDNLIIANDDISLYNLKNLKLYIDSVDEDKNIFKNYELYKYEEIVKFYNNKFDEDKIRTFLNKILNSKVLKEAFALFYGKDIKYPFSERIVKEDETKDNFNKYIKFIPLKNETTNAVTEKFSMETYIFLNKGLIASNNLNDTEKKLSSDEELINKALINGAIVEINYHELNHNFHNYFCCLENGNEPIKTPRKIEIEEREGGNNMERIMFGRVLNELNLRQALYILNEKNYDKPLNQFREDFIKLKDNYSECQGVFEEYSKIKNEMIALGDYMVIKFKPNCNYIKFKKKDDVLGFPNFDDYSEYEI